MGRSLGRRISVPEQAFHSQTSRLHQLDSPQHPWTTDVLNPTKDQINVGRRIRPLRAPDQQRAMTHPALPQLQSPTRDPSVVSLALPPASP
jgi:hypothetical protein